MIIHVSFANGMNALSAIMIWNVKHVVKGNIRLLIESAHLAHLAVKYAHQHFVQNAVLGTILIVKMRVLTVYPCAWNARIQRTAKNVMKNTFLTLLEKFAKNAD